MILKIRLDGLIENQTLNRFGKNRNHIKFQFFDCLGF